MADPDPTAPEPSVEEMQSRVARLSQMTPSTRYCFTASSRLASRFGYWSSIRGHGMCSRIRRAIASMGSISWSVRSAKLFEPQQS